MGSFALLGLHDHSDERRARGQPPRTSNIAGWDHLIPPNRGFYEVWDRVASQVETSSPAPPSIPTVASPVNAMAGLIHTVMSQAGRDPLKRKLASFIADIHRAGYLVSLIPTLAPSVSAPARQHHQLPRLTCNPWRLPRVHRGGSKAARHGPYLRPQHVHEAASRSTAHADPGTPLGAAMPGSRGTFNGQEHRRTPVRACVSRSLVRQEQEDPAYATS